MPGLDEWGVPAFGSAPPGLPRRSGRLGRGAKVSGRPTRRLGTEGLASLSIGERLSAEQTGGFMSAIASGVELDSRAVEELATSFGGDLVRPADATYEQE